MSTQKPAQKVTGVIPSQGTWQATYWFQLHDIVEKAKL